MPENQGSLQLLVVFLNLKIIRLFSQMHIGDYNDHNNNFQAFLFEFFSEHCTELYTGFSW